MSSLQPLLAGLIDYAGLFPPASLDMALAVRAYASYQRSEHAWALGRFIVPVARLGELSREIDHELSAQSAPSDRSPYQPVWRLSVLATTADAPDIGEFNARHSDSLLIDAVQIDAVEIKAATAVEICDAVRAFSGLSLFAEALYFELPPAQLAGLLPVVAEVGARAKIRTGGVTPAMIPSVDDVAAFLEACRAHQVAFKATAGLHHPLRSEHPLTYEAGCERATMHGFLNVFLAAALLFSGGSGDDARALLGETGPASLRFDLHAAHWRKRVTLPGALLCEARKRFAISFGSCSFTEPIEDLHHLRFLRPQELV
jgi:hypothetical protein